MLSYRAIDLLLYHVFFVFLQRNLHVAIYVQLHVFRIMCIDYSDLFTRCLNYYTKHSMSLHLPVTLYCSTSRSPASLAGHPLRGWPARLRGPLLSPPLPSPPLTPLPSHALPCPPLPSPPLPSLPSLPSLPPSLPPACQI